LVLVILLIMVTMITYDVHADKILICDNIFHKGGGKLKTIGLLGGMSWESSSEYYRIINQTVNRKLGGHHSAKSVMYSVDFEEIKNCNIVIDGMKQQN